MGRPSTQFGRREGFPRHDSFTSRHPGSASSKRRTSSGGASSPDHPRRPHRASRALGAGPYPGADSGWAFRLHSGRSFGLRRLASSHDRGRHISRRDATGPLREPKLQAFLVFTEQLSPQLPKSRSFLIGHFIGISLAFRFHSFPIFTYCCLGFCTLMCFSVLLHIHQLRVHRKVSRGSFSNEHSPSLPS